MIDINKLKTAMVDLSKSGDKKVFENTPAKMNIKTQNFTFETLYIPKNRHYGIPDDDYLFLKIIDESRRRSH